MRIRTVSFLLVGGLAATAGLAVACRDTATAPGGSARGVGGAPSASTQPHSAAGADVRAELHKANPMDWVGAAHNAALDAFLEELRKPGVLTKDICGYLADFSARDERVPADRRGIVNRLAPEARRDVARKALKTSPLCAPTMQSASLPSEFVRLARLAGAEAWGLTGWARATGLRAAPARQSSAAYNLLSQIDYAIYVAVDAYDLAARLNPILSAAVSLRYEEYATIAATVSVAQSSYEYWATGYPSYYDAILSEYGACADRMRSLGYSSSYARDYCMGTSSTTKNYTEFRRPGGGAGGGPVALMFVRATPRSAQECPSLGAGFKSIGRGDAKGAFTGAWAGAFTAGVEGALLGAIVGGGGVSAATALGLAWDTFWYCGSSGSKAYK